MLAFLGAWQAGIKHLSIKLTAPGRKKRERKGSGGRAENPTAGWFLPCRRQRACQRERSEWEPAASLSPALWFEADRV